MGTEIVALRKPKVQLNTREDDGYPSREYIDSYQIWKSWRVIERHTEKKI